MCAEREFHSVSQNRNILYKICRLLSSWMLHRAVWQISSNVTEEPASTVKMETSGQCTVFTHFYQTARSVMPVTCSELAVSQECQSHELCLQILNYVILTYDKKHSFINLCISSSSQHLNQHGSKQNISVWNQIVSRHSHFILPVLARNDEVP